MESCDGRGDKVSIPADHESVFWPQLQTLCDLPIPSRERTQTRLSAVQVLIFLLDCPVPTAPQSTSLHCCPGQAADRHATSSCFISPATDELWRCDSHYTTYFIPTSM
ncbi:hypothetical protein PFLUV_G00148130 [Perca fluviatilis]|uniref:Uncharacterized protein n=1 Tax=Perca fluviatilis TaxID=8168 RepID=A0A6A5F3G7_PERFL|nr:hypothetical protein PFLUV_G00148130 [Perca fluviatilis]